MSTVPTQDQNKPKPWVRLHLAKQSDSCGMPPFITGVLQQELPGQYVISNVLEMVQDQNYPEGYRIVERGLLDIISTTYVYRVEFIGDKPEINQDVYPHEGGLG